MSVLSFGAEMIDSSEEARGQVMNISSASVGRSPGGGNGNPLQYSCLENPMDKGAWRATVHAVEKRWTKLSDLARTFTLCRQVQWTAVLEYQYHRPS